MHSSPEEQEFEYEKGSDHVFDLEPIPAPGRVDGRVAHARQGPVRPRSRPSDRLPPAAAQHGLGGAQDLPISRELAILGAAAAVAVSFVVLVLAWRKPRYDAATSGRPAPAWLARLVDSALYRGVLRLVGLLGLLYLVLVAVRGKDLLINPIFGIVYVWIWVGMVVASLLFGRVWKAISPFRLINGALARVSGGDPEDGVLTYPERLGMWPAAVGLFAFVWMELVYPHNVDLGPVRLWCAVYLASDDPRRRAVREPLLRARRPLRGVLQPRRAAVGLGPARRPARDPQPARQPRHHRRPPRGWWRSSRCCSAARPSTRSASPRAG